MSQKPPGNWAVLCDGYTDFYDTEAEALAAAAHEIRECRESSKINGVWDGHTMRPFTEVEPSGMGSGKESLCSRPILWRNSTPVEFFFFKELRNARVPETSETDRGHSV